MREVGAAIGVPIFGLISDLTYSKRSPVTMVSCILVCIMWYFYTIDYYKITYGVLMVGNLS